MTTSFFPLLKLSFLRVRNCGAPVLFAALLCGVMNGLPFLFAPSLFEEEQSIGMMMQRSMNGEVVEQVAEETVPAETVPPERAALAIIAFVLAVPFTIFLAFSIMVAVVEGNSASGAVFKRTLRVFFPVIGTSFWMFVVSYVWVPMVPAFGLLLWDAAATGEPTPTGVGVAMLLILSGAVIGFVRMPRLYFAPIILIRESTGITQSVRLSYQRTNGYWGKIVGNSLLFGLIMMAIMMPVMMVMGILSFGFIMLGMVGPFMMIVLMYAVQMFLSALQQAFHTELALTIFDNPKA